MPVKEGLARLFIRQELMRPVLARQEGRFRVGAVVRPAQALQFMRAHPSRSGDLHHAGQAFPAFLSTGIGAGGTGYEYLVDLARLEWAWQCALLAADAPALGTEALAAIPPSHWPTLRFRLQPALQIIESRWPVYTLFLEQRRAEPAIVQLNAGAESAGVLRRGQVVEVHRLSSGEAALWSALRCGETLDAAVARAVDATPGGELQLAPVLAQLFALGAVTHLDASTADA